MMADNLVASIADKGRPIDFVGDTLEISVNEHLSTESKMPNVPPAAAAARETDTAVTAGFLAPEGLPTEVESTPERAHRPLADKSADDVNAEGCFDESEEYEDEEGPESDEGPAAGGDTSGPFVRLRRRRRQPRQDAEELRLRGRRALCKSITDIAPLMLKMVKLRILGRYLDSVRRIRRG